MRKNETLFLWVLSYPTFGYGVDIIDEHLLRHASYDAVLSIKLSPYGCKETQNKRHRISIYWNWKRRQVNEPLFWLGIINAKRPSEQCLNKKIRNNNLGRYKIKISITIKRIYNNTSERRKIWLPIYDSCLFESRNYTYLIIKIEDSSGNKFI